MATVNDLSLESGFFARKLAIVGPLSAQAAVWLTTAGHTANFREMNDARGWIPSVGFSLHSAYLFSVAISILLAPALRRLVSSHTLAQAGLGLLAAGSLLNGLNLHLPFNVAVFGRLLVGFGAGQAMVAAPRLLPARRPRAVDFSEILLPALGPMVIALASMSYDWSDWEGAFIFEAILGLLGLACIIPLAPPPEPLQQTQGTFPYLPPLALGLAALWYLLHWGQLSGWSEDVEVIYVGFGGIFALIVALWFAWPAFSFSIVREGLARGIFVGYAGAVQFFQVAETGISGGVFININEWQRACLIFPLGLGAAISLLAGRLTWRATRPGRLSTAFGLMMIAAGMAYANALMLDWPFWNIQNVVEFNWFAAPQVWEFAPGRFLMGFGFGMVILSETHRAGRNPIREERIEVGLQAAQFLGAGIGIGILATALLTGHQSEYSYAADRGWIQADEIHDRTERLTKYYSDHGAMEPARKARMLLFKSTNYEADVQMFANIYAGFAIVSLILAFSLLQHFISRSLGDWIARTLPATSTRSPLSLPLSDPGTRHSRTADCEKRQP